MVVSKDLGFLFGPTHMTDPQHIRRAKNVFRHSYDYLRSLLARNRAEGEQFMGKKKEPLPSHLRRLIFVIIAVIIGTFLIYSVIPREYVDRDLHKKLTVERESARGISFAGDGACAECHEEEYDLSNSSYHRDVSCEVCHGAGFAHTEDDAVIPPAPRERTLCPLCHLYDPARPTGFPQINPIVHNPMQPCINCHDPHDPTTPEPPQECTACHAKIASMKSLSHHALLECTTCHETPEQHKITPRGAMPTLPKSREFCGQCHAEDAEQSGVPKVSLAEHGEKYLCWQCHYAHMPEVQ